MVLQHSHNVILCIRTVHTYVCTVCTYIRMCTYVYSICTCTPRSLGPCVQSGACCGASLPPVVLTADGLSSCPAISVILTQWRSLRPGLHRADSSGRCCLNSSTRVFTYVHPPTDTHTSKHTQHAHQCNHTRSERFSSNYTQHLRRQHRIISNWFITRICSFEECSLLKATQVHMYTRPSEYNLEKTQKCLKDEPV